MGTERPQVVVDQLDLPVRRKPVRVEQALYDNSVGQRGRCRDNVLDIEGSRDLTGGEGGFDVWPEVGAPTLVTRCLARAEFAVPDGRVPETDPDTVHRSRLRGQGQHVEQRRTQGRQ